MLFCIFYIPDTNPVIRLLFASEMLKDPNYLLQTSFKVNTLFGWDISISYREKYGVAAISGDQAPLKKPDTYMLKKLMQNYSFSFDDIFSKLKDWCLVSFHLHSHLEMNKF